MCWLPISPQKNSEARAALSEYYDQNDIVPVPSARKNVRRQRAKSMFAERSNDQSFTMEEMHSEFITKYASPNRGLKSTPDRLLPESKHNKPSSEWEKLREEFKKKLEAKKNKK